MKTLKYIGNNKNGETAETINGVKKVFKGDKFKCTDTIGNSYLLNFPQFYTEATFWHNNTRIIGIITGLIVTILGGIIVLFLQPKGLSQEELFQKKQECASYKDQIQEEISKQLGINSLNEIFYSPTRNSCMYRYSNVNAEAVVDYFTKEVVIDALNLFDTNDTGVQEILMEGQRTFIKGLKELKGE